MQFISTRTFASCFEYRSDGDTSQASGDPNYNTDILDGLYPFFCENDSTRTQTISAIAYVEVRMVFGAETDERFDWTRFDVPYECVGFQPPADKPMKVKKNRVIPLTAELLYGVTPVIDTELSSPPVVQVIFDLGEVGEAPVTDLDLPAGKGTDGNVFEFVNGTWKYNLRAKDYSGPGTYIITMVPGDTSYIIDPTCTATFEIP